MLHDAYFHSEQKENYNNFKNLNIKGTVKNL